jgi:hypothetical protein
LLPHLVRFLLLFYMRSYRYFPPLLVFLLGLMMLYVYPAKQAMPTYAASAVLVYFISAWIAAGFMGAIHGAQEHIAAVHAGSVRMYLVGKTLAIFACGSLVCFTAMIYPVAADRFTNGVSVGEWLTALLAHLELSLLGGLAALILNRTVIRNGSMAIFCLLTVQILSIVRNGVLNEIGSGFAPLFILLPPVAPVIDWLMNADTHASGGSVMVWIGPPVYGAVLYVIYLRIVERQM